MSGRTETMHRGTNTSGIHDMQMICKKASVILSKFSAFPFLFFLLSIFSDSPSPSLSSSCSLLPLPLPSSQLGTKDNWEANRFSLQVGE